MPPDCLLALADLELYHHQLSGYRWALCDSSFDDVVPYDAYFCVYVSASSLSVSGLNFQLLCRFSLQY